MDSRSYWNANLDTDNRSRRGGAENVRLDEALAFARTPEFEWLLERFGNAEGRIVIDLGGGVGMHALLWARAGARVVVVDLALERMKSLREVARRAGLAERISFVVGRGEFLPLSAETADAVFTKSVLIHTDLPIAAQEIRRALRPGGQGLFIEPLVGNPIIQLYRIVLAPRIWRSITRYFDRRSLDTLRRPFGRLRWKPFYLLSAWSFFWQYGWKRPDRFGRSLRRWRRFDRRLLRRWPRLDTSCWFAAIEVRREK
jgi:SAM-dependent methyltransferase